MKRWVKTISRFLFAVMFVNFTLFWCISFFLGGDALSGTIEDGRYYFVDDGKVTQVSEAVWNYSYCHTISVFITHPLGLGSMALADILEK